MYRCKKTGKAERRWQNHQNWLRLACTCHI